MNQGAILRKILNKICNTNTRIKKWHKNYEIDNRGIVVFHAVPIVFNTIKTSCSAFHQNFTSNGAIRSFFLFKITGFGYS